VLWENFNPFERSPAMQINSELLAAQPFFKGLSAPQLELLAVNAMSVEFKAV
jgi:hypothetical protein